MEVLGTPKFSHEKHLTWIKTKIVVKLKKNSKL